MIINQRLVSESLERLREAGFNLQDLPGEFDKLDKQVGDGPLHLDAGVQQLRYRQLLAETGSPDRARMMLERIIGGNDLDGINYLSRGLAAARSVARIQIRSSSGELLGYATGFLAGPGVLMTNHHVFESAAAARHSLADFDYELDAANRERKPAHFRLDPARLFYANQKLDFAIVAVHPSAEDGRDLRQWSWLGLNAQPGKSDVGEYLTIIQHPNGERKQICVRENKFVKFTGDMMWYLTDTLGGSSGSPVFNRFWQVVALHHSGVPKTNKQNQWLTRTGDLWAPWMGDAAVDWIANEGVRVSAIVAHLRQNMAAHPMVQAMLDTPAPPFEQAPPAAPDPSGRAPWIEDTGGAASLVVPLRIPLEVVRLQAPAPQPPAAPAILASLHPPYTPVEAVSIDQSTLGSRPGYKPNFLGSGRLLAPLPKIPPALRPKVARLKAKPAQSELKYFNYSVVMNKERRLAFFSAVNIDGALRTDAGRREGDKWFLDPRIDAAFQIGDEFYGRQKTFEADRTLNPFDRGHLVRRLDATWGPDPDTAKKHGDDTFHFTNCSPQFWAFNQGKRLWLGLEDFVLDQLEKERRKACVFNGPVFDGPEAPEGGLPNAADPGRSDPTFGGVAIPKYFWKLMVFARDGALAATAFLMSQQDQILKIDRIREEGMLEKLSQAQARVFQVSIQDLSVFTGLDFGPLAQADTKETSMPRPRLIADYSDIRL